MLRPVIAAAVLLGLAASPAAAEIVSRSDDAFTLRFSARTQAGPARIDSALAALPNWWDPAHTYSGDSSNLSLDLTPGGCWCEKLADGTDFDHGRTVSVALGDIRFHAPFGPLRDKATRADLIVGFSVVDRATEPVWTFVVEGPGLGRMAEAVDGVMAGGFARWIHWLETGTPPT